MASDREHAPDWILREALQTQHSANKTWVMPGSSNGGMPPPAHNSTTTTNSDEDDNDMPNRHRGEASSSEGLTLTVLGCGTMGIAILGGIMDSISLSSHTPDHVSIPFPKGLSTSGSSTPAEPLPQKLPTTFNACVRRHQSAKRIKAELGRYEAYKKLTIYENDNLGPVQDADVILLACKPQMVGDIFSSKEMRDACKGKLLISICAGVTEKQIEQTLASSSGSKTEAEEKKCTVVRVMPNTAAAVRESMTVIATSQPPLPQETSSLITWIFTRIGRVVHLPSSTMDASTALCGSGPAFAALFLESLVAGGVAMGLPRDEAYIMAAQTMRGTTGLVLGGEHPAILKDKVSTPGGCTIGGLLVLEENSLKGTVAKAVREATVVASQLGQGKQGVNGTRFV